MLAKRSGLAVIEIAEIVMYIRAIVDQPGSNWALDDLYSSLP